MSEAGEIIGRLKLDSSQFRAEVLAAKAQLDALTSERTDVHVGTTGTSRAVTELKAVEKAEDGVAKAAVTAAAAEATLEKANTRTARSSSSFTGEARKQADALAVLTKAAIVAAPALLPVAAGATGAAAALGGLGAAAILAGTGIARGLGEGSRAAAAYRPLIQDLLDDLHQLQDTASAGLLPGATATVDRLQAAMPVLNRETAMWSAQLGRILPTGVDAIVTGLERAEPLLQAGGDSLIRFVDYLDRAAHSQGFADFVDYAIANLPKAEALLSDSMQLAGDFMREMAPYADTMLDIATGAVRVADALTPIAPALWATWAGFTAWRGAVGIIDLVRGRLALLGAEAVATNAKLAGGGAGAGGAGATAVAGAALFGAYALGDMKNSGAKILGVQGEAGRSEKDAQRLIAQLVGSAAGSGGVGATAGTAPWLRDLYNGPLGNLASVGGASGQVDASRNASALDQTFASMVTSGNGEKAAAMVKQFAAAAHLSGTEVAALLPNYTSAEKAFTRTGSAAVVAATHVGGLAGELDLASSSAVVAEQTLVGAGDAIAAAGQQFRQSAKDSKAHAVSLSASTEAGRANRTALTNAVLAVNQHAQAMVANGKSQGQATLYTYRQIDALREQATKAGASKGEVDKLISTLTGLDKSFVAKIDANTLKAIAKVKNLEERLAGLDGATATVYLDAITRSKVPNQVSSALIASGRAVGGTVGNPVDDARAMLKALPRHASGTTVRGPGSAASDSVLSWLSAGEEVVSNLKGQASANRPMLKAINSGDRSKIARTAQEQYGGRAPIRIEAHFTDDGSYVAGIARQTAEQVVSAYEAAGARTQRMGWRSRGIRG